MRFDAHCPVYDIFSQATPIERTIAVPHSRKRSWRNEPKWAWIGW